MKEPKMVFPSKKTYRITTDALMAMLQGKEVHFITHNYDSSEEIVILPPQGNVVMTREEIHELKMKAHDIGFMEAIDLLVRKNGIFEEEIKEIES